MDSVVMPRWTRVCMFAALLGAGGGCANLTVKKVPLQERAVGADKQQGFRYYLNRPYLVVKTPIQISESSALVRVVPPKLGKEPEKKEEAMLEFLDGPRRGQQTRLADLQVGAPGSPTMRAVTPAELGRIAEALDAASKPLAPVAPQPAHDNNVVQVQTSQSTLDEGSARIALSGAPDDAAAFGTINTDSIDIKNVGTTAPSHADPLSGDMQIIYLPDLDEQYAIKSCNTLAKSAFGLAFRNGSELSEVQGEHDATTLSLALLQQIQNAIATVQGVEQASIQQQSKAAQVTQPGKGKGGAAASTIGSAIANNQGEQPVWLLVQKVSIKPGVYRLNKPWEIEGGPESHPVGCGLLARLGLPTVVSVDFRPVGAIK